MTYLPYTTTALLRAGYSPAPLDEAVRRAFTDPGQASVRTVQHFWDAFVDAHRKIYRGGALQEAA